jgi:tRNA pseudouridine55 synthase
LARAGADATDVEIKSREVTVHRLIAARFSTHTAHPRAMLHITCSSGTYIRSLVRDIGRVLGCGATMTFLVRTRSGSFTLDEACTVEQIGENVAGTVIPLSEVLRWCTHKVVIDEQAVQDLKNGRQAEIKLSSGKCDSQTVEHDVTYTFCGDQEHHDEADLQRVLVLNEAETVAVIAVFTQSSGRSYYRADKVFNPIAP